MSEALTVSAVEMVIRTWNALLRKAPWPRLNLQYSYDSRAEGPSAGDAE